MTPFDQNGKSRRQSSVKICKLWGFRGMGVVVEGCQLLPLHGSLLKYHSHESNHSRGHKQNMRRPTQPAAAPYDVAARIFRTAARMSVVLARSPNSFSRYSNRIPCRPGPRTNTPATNRTGVSMIAKLCLSILTVICDLLLRAKHKHTYSRHDRG